MPEIYEMFINLSELFRLIPRPDTELDEQISKYENELEKNMSENRLRLFSEYGYNSEFEKAYFE